MIDSFAVRLVAAGLALTAPAWAQDEPTQQDPMYLGTEPLESCLGRWDPGTHMTKSEWEDACKRIHDERGTYLKEHGGAPDAKQAPGSP